MVASMPTRRFLLALLPLAFPVGLAACSSGGGGGGSAGADPAAPSSGGGAAEPAADEAPRPSPLEEFMGWDPRRRIEMSEEDVQKNREVEDRIVECMQAEGFEYIAQDPSVDPTGLSDIDALPPDEFAEQYGYGITTIDREAAIDQAREADPNNAVFDGLSEAARRQYFVAMNGAATAAEKFGEPPPSDAEAAARPGCRPQAEEAVFGSQEKPPLPADLEEVRREIDALDEQVRSDPRVDVAATAWADCMAGAGHPEQVHPDDVQLEIARRWWQLYGLELPEGLVEPGADPRPGGVRPGVPGPRAVDGQEPDPEALVELRQYEVDVAVADLGCRPAYDDVVREVRDELERAFIEDHRAELEHFRDAIALAGGEG
jgi:hypothetical protein